MPKKKLTKAQLKRKLKTIQGYIFDLFLDKISHADSFIVMSKPKLDETLVLYTRMLKLQKQK